MTQPPSESVQSDSVQRFSDRVDNYARYRPSYPAAIVQILRDQTEFDSDALIADVGSGTGISSELFLKQGNTVFGIEPNLQMRQAAQPLLDKYPRFQSIDGTAEATTLPAASVDYVVAAQAFHWYDPAKSQKEFARILRPGGWVVLICNARRLASTPFLHAYEQLLQTYGTDYLRVRAENIDLVALKSYFAGGRFVQRELYNQQRFDLSGLTGRLLSSSYTPAPRHPNHQPMLAELKKIFVEHAERGQVCFEYDTKLYFGHIG